MGQASILMRYGDDAWAFFCPGCKMPHAPNKTWTFNGNFDKPTFSPSILVTHPQADKPMRICHSYVTEGRIQFLADCTHELAGQTVDLPELPDWLRDEEDEKP